jgi:hypothetical protein
VVVIVCFLFWVAGVNLLTKKTDLTYLDFRNIVDLWDLSGIVWWILG